VTWDDLLQLAGQPALRERGPREHGWTSVHCPLHDDRDASASLSSDRRTIRCHSGCDRAWGIYAGAVALGMGRDERDAAAILQEYADRRDGIAPQSRSDGYRPPLATPRPTPLRKQTEQRPPRPADPRERPRNVPPHARVAAEYPYASADGRQALKVRWEWAADGQAKPAKDLRWYHVGKDGLHYWGVPDGWKLGLYHEVRVREVAQAGGIVYLVEGEKCVEALNAALTLAGIADAFATTLGKESDLLPEHLDAMEGARRIVVLADSDTKGRTKGQRHAAQIREQSAAVKYLDLYPERHDIKGGLDVADWLPEHTLDELDELIERAPIATTAADEEEPDESDDAQEWPDEKAAPWPRMDPAAYHGLAGELIAEIEAQTESDPVALLVTLLAAFGSAAGAGSYVIADSAEHAARLYVVLVGGTSSGRKGSSLAVIRRFLKASDDEWFRAVVRSGFLSGESIIADLAGDLDEEAEPNPYPKVILVIEPELGRLLAVNNRDQSTTSHVIRDGWDGSTLSAIRRAKRTRVEDVHMSLIGHVVPEELAEKLTPTEIYNGFANRCLFLCVRRSRKLSSGGYIAPEIIARYGARLREAMDFGRQGRREMKRTPAAERLWDKLYHEELDTDGLLGAFTARGPAQMLRLSLIYALLDLREEIDVEHLQAAAAVWRYAVASVRRRLDSSLTDDEKKLLDALRAAWPQSMTGREVHQLFSRSRSAKERGQIVGRLVERRLATSAKAPTGGNFRKPASLVRALSLVEAAHTAHTAHSVTSRVSQRPTDALTTHLLDAEADPVAPEAEPGDSESIVSALSTPENVPEKPYNQAMCGKGGMCDPCIETAPEDLLPPVASDGTPNAWPQDVILDDDGSDLV